MNYSFMATLLIIVFLIYHNKNRSERQRKKSMDAFWARENAANSTRRKPLDGLDYIKIPLDKLPLGIMTDDPKAADCIRAVNELSMQPIVNLTGYSNTDLKLEYGTANITVLSEYDQSYTLLANTLQQWAQVLYDGGYPDEARTVLEFAIDTGTDVRHSYELLTRICQEQLPEPEFREKLEELLKAAEGLRSLNRDVILHHLNDIKSSL